MDTESDYAVSMSITLGVSVPFSSVPYYFSLAFVSTQLLTCTELHKLALFQLHPYHPNRTTTPFPLPTPKPSLTLILFPNASPFCSYSLLLLTLTDLSLQYLAIRDILSFFIHTLQFLPLTTQ